MEIGYWLLLAALIAPPAVPKPEVLYLASPNYDERPAGTAIDTIVIHDTNMPNITRARVIANHFLNPRSQVSAHYIIGKSGEIIQCVKEEKRAWHAGPSLMGNRTHVNDFSIGIELVNDESGRDPFTEGQYKALSELVAHLMSRYAIPRENIIGHRDIAMPRGRKKDPADNFDWGYLWQKTQWVLEDHQYFAVRTRPCSFKGNIRSTSP